MEFQILIVDDEPQIADEIEELISGNKILVAPNSIVCKKYNSFEEAKKILETEVFDLVILDLKDDATQKNLDPSTNELAGETLAQKIKQVSFVPIVFYSGYSEKLRQYERPYIRMVIKGEPQKLRSAIKDIFDTKIPHLNKHIKQELRDYMWDSIETLWPSELAGSDSYEIVYLIARRLSSLLQSDMVREFLINQGAQLPAQKNVHPIELYVWPPLSKKSFFYGDILKTVDGNDKYFIVLSPSCDLQQSKADNVLLGECKLLDEHEDASKVRNIVIAKSAVSGAASDTLKKLLKDNGKQKDRFKFLPGTTFLPDLLLDLQSLSTSSFAELTKEDSLFEKIASLDTPFAESLQNQFTRYFGRVGTPDLSIDIAYAQCIRKWEELQPS